MSTSVLWMKASNDYAMDAIVIDAKVPTQEKSVASDSKSALTDGFTRLFEE